MLDIKFIRENKDLITEAARKKRIKFSVDKLIEADEERRKILASVEAKRTVQNDFNNKVVSETNATLKLQVPNIPDVSVPEGDSDADNKEIKKWGNITEFAFKPKNHIEIMKSLDMVDFDRGTKVAGFRGYFLKNDGALLSLAIWNYAVEFFTKKGFAFYIVPSLVRRENLMGTGFIPQGEDDLYKTQDGDYLAGTAEVGLMGLHDNEILDKKDFPKKYLGFSPCFRREAGSHSKDVKGLIRVHEFYKLEQVILCEA